MNKKYYRRCILWDVICAASKMSETYYQPIVKKFKMSIF